MKVYLAAPYAARAQIKGYADELEQIGYEVVATWLDETHEIGAGTVAAATDLTDHQADQHAQTDLYDLARAHLFIAFTGAVCDLVGGTSTSGGRHVETGYALAKKIPVIVVGEPENVFHRMHHVRVYPTWHDALLEAAARLVQHERFADQVRVEAG